MSLKWRAIFCRPRQEGRALVHLLNQNYQAFLPKVRSRKRIRGRDRTLIEPMFPRYLFVALADHRQDWSPIRSTRGVIGLVRAGDEVPIVPSELIAELMDRHDTRGAIDLTDAHTPRPDDRVQITAGPFTGYEGLFQARSGEERAVILLQILNRERKIEIPAHDIRKMG